MGGEHITLMTSASPELEIYSNRHDGVQFNAHRPSLWRVLQEEYPWKPDVNPFTRRITGRNRETSNILPEDEDKMAIGNR